MAPADLTSPLPLNAAVVMVSDAFIAVLGERPALDARFADLGGTSADAVELTMALEARLALVLPADLVGPSSTVAGLARQLIDLTATMPGSLDDAARLAPPAPKPSNQTTATGLTGQAEVDPPITCGPIDTT